MNGFPANRLISWVLKLGSLLVSLSLLWSCEPENPAVITPETPHIPATKEEIHQSIELSYELNGKINSIADSLKTDGSFSFDALGKAIANIDGVLKVIGDEDETTLSVMQKDSIIFNIIMPTPTLYESMPNLKYDSSISSRALSASAEPMSVKTKSLDGTDGGYQMIKSRKALFLAPFPDLSSPYPSMLLEPFFDEKPEVLEGPEATIDKFKGDYFQDFKFIVIHTHGGIGYKAVRKAEDTWDALVHFSKYIKSDVDRVTIFISASVYDDSTIDSMIDRGEFDWEDIALAIPLGEKEYHFCMTPGFLDGADLKDAIVISSACHSAEIWSGKGSMKEAFVDKAKAAFYSGYTDSADATMANIILFYVANFLTRGLSITEAMTATKTDPALNLLTDSTVKWLQSLSRFNSMFDKVSKENYIAANNLDLLHFGTRDDLESTSFFLVDPHPSSLESRIDGDKIVFTWDCNMGNWDWPVEFEENIQPYTQIEKLILEYRVRYDVYVDGNKLGLSVGMGLKDKEKKTATWKPSSPGEHSWYVVANVIEVNSGNLLGSYRSQEEKFQVSTSTTVTTSQPTGVSTTSASVQVSYTTNAKVVEQGVIVSTSNSYPTSGGTGCRTFTSSSTTSPFTVSLSGLTPETVHYARGYVQVEDGDQQKYFYGNTVSFTTSRDVKPQISVSPSTLRFDSVEAGDSEQKNITITNTGIADLTIDSFSASGPFSVGISAPRTIKASGTLNVPVTYSPSSEGSHTGVLTISSNASNSPKVSVNLSGSATTPSQAIISLSNQSISLGNVRIGESASYKMTIYNEGNADLSVSSITSSDPTVFKTDVSSCTIAGNGGRKVVTVTFTPKNVKQYKETLTIRSNASNGTSKTVSLSGYGDEEAKAMISVDKENLNFGIVTVGESKTLTFRVTNTGAAPLQITKIGVTATECSVSPTSMTVDGNGGVRTVSVTYKPTSKGYVEDVVFIKSNAANYDTKYVLISGEAEEKANNTTSVTSSVSSVGAESVHMKGTFTYIHNEYNYVVKKGIVVSSSISQPVFGASGCIDQSFYDDNTDEIDGWVHGLKPNTRYYARTFICIGAIGQETYHYSNVVTFTTVSSSTPALVDLGLPSGTKWARWSLGGANQFDKGKEYNYSQAESAVSALGTGWSIPTKEQWEELWQNCTWEKSEIQGEWGFKVTSKKNGNALFICCPLLANTVGHLMHFWTSTPLSSQHIIVASFFFDSNYVPGNGIDPDFSHGSEQSYPRPVLAVKK